ncbi:hypothetical protein [Vibrio coralliilyticus]|uniref:hypothetical protein n=1 Tax=Vibrio coralliilyticus TaxID=190893 RepID=UPI0002E25262|nr:hypothetical protein [Vibrio coralliilyticus]
MSAAQHLKSVVTLGGAVDPSFKNMASEVDKHLGSATKEVKTLEREQKNLTKQIKKAKLAGADVSLLTKQYDKLGDEIDQASRSAEGFQAASDLNGSLKSTATYAAATTAGLVGVTGSVIALTSATNAATAEQAGFAKAYGMSIEQFNAWGGIATQAGLNAENTGDLVEELTNKFGEFKVLGEQSSVSDVFGSLGIDAAMMDGLSAAEQFEFVMRRLEKVGDAQQAASLADMLFGGEGNKVVTYIKNSGKSLNELLDAQKAINNLTQEGADGALKYNTALNSVTKSMYTAWQDVAGVVGGEVAPVFEDLSITVSSFVRENRAEIIDFLSSAVEGSLAFARGVFTLGSAVNDVVQVFGGWETVAAGVAGLMAGKMVIGLAGIVSGVGTMITTLGAVKTAMIGINAVMMANPIGSVAAAVGLLTAAGVALCQNWDAVKEWFEPFFGWFEAKWEGLLALGDKAKELLKSVTGFLGFDETEKDTTLKANDDSEAVRPTRTNGYYGGHTQSSPSSYGYGARAQAANQSTYAAAGGNTVHQKVDKIEIHAAPGQSSEDIGKEVANRLGGEQDAMFDIAMGD